MNRKLFLLRLLLGIVAANGLLSGFALFVPWKVTAEVCKRIGIEGVPEITSPILEYWLLMMAATCVVVGLLYLVAAVNPWKYRSCLPYLGWALVIVGAFAGYHGLRLGLPPWPFYADMATCAVCGSGTVWLSRSVPAS